MRSFLKRNRYLILAFVASAVGAGLGAEALMTAWETAGIEKWAFPSRSIAERIEFRIFWVSGVGALIGAMSGAFWPTFWHLRALKKEFATKVVLGESNQDVGGDCKQLD